jgi:adenylosuccinate lyase
MIEMDRFDAVSPIDYRYYGDDPTFRARLQPYLSENANIAYLLRVEVALVRMLAKWGICAGSVAGQVEQASRDIKADEVYEEERRVHHNIRALVNCIRGRIPPESRPFVHLFATSADIMDTAAALRYRELVRDILLPDLIDLEQRLISLASRYADQHQIGRTHGQHAVPTTFGYSLALYVSRIGSRIEVINKAHRNLRGKFSGAVGAFNALSLYYPGDPAVLELELMESLGLKPVEPSVSSQIAEPEPLTDLVYSVISCFSVFANLADDMRNLIRNEIGEVVERYQDDEVGSSTMPHKMNPKNFENVKSLWKEFMPRMNTVFMDQISEHQRDLTNSASARFVPEIFAGFCYASFRMNDALAKVLPNGPRMLDNLGSSKQHVVAEPLYIMLALHGFPDAYDTVMQLSRESRKTGVTLLDLARKRADLAPYFERFSERHKAILSDPTTYIGAAPARTAAVCDYWEPVCDTLRHVLQSEREASNALATAKLIQHSDENGSL